MLQPPLDALVCDTGNCDFTHAHPRCMADYVASPKLTAADTQFQIPARMRGQAHNAASGTL